jgi:hypothetical protein
MFGMSEQDKQQLVRETIWALAFGLIAAIGAVLMML